MVENAGATYQRLMDKVLAPMLGRNVYAYVDDMVIASKDRAQHVVDLEELFVTISKYHLKLNPEKCFMYSNHRHAKPDVSEGSAAADGAYGGTIKICLCWRREGAPVFPVP